MATPSKSRIALAVATIAICARADAQDRFELEVYEGDINRPLQFGLEAHINYFAIGNRAPEYAGQIPLDQAAHVTFEPSFSVTKWLEFGAYLQFLWSTDTDAHFGGFKLRAKLIPAMPDGSPWHWGANFEVANMPLAAEQNPWSIEIRPIFGYDDGHWFAFVNPIIGCAITGPEASHVSFEPAAKVGWNTQRGFALGAEYFSVLGAIDQGFVPFSRQEHLLLAAFDLAAPAGVEEPASGFEMNLGIGRSLSTNDEMFVVKVIVGRTF